MSDHLTEEEQLETLKRLWKEYGATIIAAVVVAVGGYLGWNYWQDQQRIKAETASALFEQLQVAASDNPAATGDVAELAERLKAHDASSIYAWQAGLYAAREAVENGDLDTARDELEWVLSVSRDQGISAIAHLRLARVMAAQGEYEQALGTLEAVGAAAYAAERAEIRGDILRMSGDDAEARLAYEEALTGVQDDQQRRMLIQMKLDDLASARAGSDS